MCAQPLPQQAEADPFDLSTFVIRVCLDPPAAIDVNDARDVTVMVVEEGQATITRAGAKVEVTQGDVILISGDTPYSVAHPAGTPTTAVIDKAHRCTSLDGQPLTSEIALGVRTWGHRADATMRILVATIADDAMARAIQRRVGDRPWLLADAAGRTPYTAALGHEATHGSQAILRRLAALVALDVARQAGSPLDDAAPADPQLAQLVRTVRESLTAPWSVQAMATEMGLTRSAFSARFTREYSLAPGRALTQWRIALAGELVASTALTLDAIARRCGYSDGFALSHAYERVTGERPQAARSRSRRYGH